MWHFKGASPVPKRKSRRRHSKSSNKSRSHRRDGSRIRVRVQRLKRKDGERAVWEYHTVPINRVPGYGFGIAVSGGRDNPHFSNGDPAIAISDVLKAGPAEGRLLINDRVISVNGTSLENVEYAKAVQVLRDSASPVHLLIKRRVVLPGPQQDFHTLRITLTKNKKKDDFGIVLGCKLFIKEITNKNVNGKDSSGVAEGDIITKINNTPTDALTLKEAKKLIENCKEKLQLVVRREATKNTNENTQNVYDNTTTPLKNDVNNMHSFSDVNEMRNYSNQNLYVQPPIRGDKYRSPPPPPEDKNNLTRMSGRSRGPLMDISLSQLDQPATPLLQGHNHTRSRVIAEEDEPPPRPPPPQYDGNVNQPSTPLSQSHLNSELYDDDPLSRRGKVPLPDPRFISFLKEGSVGIRLTGGNQTGIFVTAVQPGSPASLQGLQPGDKILKVNNFDMKDVTREEAVLYLLNLQDRIDLIVQYRREEYDGIVASQAGDSFYVRTHFNYDNVNKSELSFRIGDVFHVVDTLYNGVVGSWQVYRIGRNNQQTQKGIIPNKSRAEELAVERANSAKKESFSESRGSFFKRRSARRTKLLMDSASKFPSYERITLRHPGFTRPVILLGPLSDAARDKLLKDSPAKFVSPQLDNHLDDSPKSKSAAIVRLSAIKEISERGKHAVVDITPNAVDRLNYAQFYPIVIFMRADNKHVIKDLRSRLSKSTGKSSKKLFDHMVKLEKTWSHIFTATVTLTSADTWYKKIKEVIEMQQQQPIWMSETKPEEPITDDFLFPTTSRLSYASSPESDLDLATDINHRNPSEPITPMYGERRLVKASSDPSIATQEDIGLPSYHGPPPYNEFDNCPYPSQSSAADQTRVDGTNEDQFYNKYYLSNDNRNSISQHVVETRHKYNAYNSRPVSDTYSERPNGELMDPYGTKSRSPPKVPPKIDRGSKPSHLRSAHERLFGANQTKDNIEPNAGAGNYINTAHKPLDMKPYNYQGSCESSSYGSDSYGKLPVVPPDDSKNRDQQLRMAQMAQMSHDPYRYTRSTAQPIRNKMLDMNVPKYNSSGSSSNRNEYKPIPPPKPKNYRSPNSGLPTEGYWNREDEMARNKLMYDIAKPESGRLNNYNENDYGMRPPTNYYGGKSYGLNDHNLISELRVNGGMKNRCDSDSAGFDSGQGSSLDRNYDTTHKTASPSRRGGGGYYYNVPPPREVPHHHRDASGLDLSNRENRGSAFELYKKPNSLHGFSPLTVNVDTLKFVGTVDVESSSTSGSSSSSSTSSCKDSQDGNGNIQEANHIILGSGRGKFDAQGGKIECAKTGVCLVIPPGALPSDSEQEIFFKVCQDNNLLPPLDKDKGEKLLSPLVMCGPHGLNFNKPVELRLPHCATKNQEDWSFALKTSETPTGNHSKWKNLSLDRENQVGQWRVDGDYVTLLIDHF